MKRFTLSLILLLALAGVGLAQNFPGGNFPPGGGSTGGGSANISGTTGKIIKFTGVTSGGNSSFFSETSTNPVLGAAPVFSSAAVSSSATPAFDATKLFNTYSFAQNVTSSTITGAADNQLYGQYLCQDATGDRTFVPPTSFTQALAPARNASACNSALYWKQPSGNFQLAAEPHVGAAGNIYVSNQGNDSNDGFSLATAKLTVIGGIQACPPTYPAPGCIIHVYGNNWAGRSGGVNGSATAFNATNGVWLCAGQDAGCPGTGFFNIGIGGPLIVRGEVPNNFGSNSTHGLATLYGCSATDVTKPLLWITGNNGPITFENIDFGQGSCAKPVAYGIPIAGGRTGSGGTTVSFINCRVAPSRADASYGPGIDIADNTFWTRIIGLSCDANTTAAVTDYARACIGIDPGAGAGAGSLFIEGGRFNGAGGIKHIPGTSGSGITVKDTIMESDGVKGCAPVYWNTGTHLGTFATIEDVEHADCPTATSKSVVQNDSSDPAWHWTVRHAVTGNSVAFQVQGPHTILGGERWDLSTTGPEANNSMGFWGGTSGSASGTNGRIAGQTDAARRSFSPVAVPYTNLATQKPASWTIVTGSVTTGQAAPDGTTQAVEVSTASGICDIRPYQVGSFTPTAGEIWVGGVWARAHTAANGFGNSGTTIVKIGLQNGTFTETGTGTISATAPVTGDGEWEWLSFKGTTASGTVGVANMSLSCKDSTHPVDFYAPILWRFAPAAISAGEAAYLREHLQTYAETATAGDVTTMRRSRFSFGVANSDFFGKFTDATFTADHTFTWPDKAGTVALIDDTATPSIYDNFTRANGAIGANYAAVSGGLSVSSNTVINGGSTDAFSYWTATTIPNDQYAQAYIAVASTGSNGLGVSVRSASGQNTCWETSTALKLTGNTLNLSSVITEAAGDLLRVEIVGTTTNCWRNGVLVLTGTDTGSHSGGPGMYIHTVSGGGALDNFSAGPYVPYASLKVEQDVIAAQHFLAGFSLNTNGFQGTFAAAPITAARTWTLPDKSGTVAMTSDLTTGTQPVNTQSGTTYTVVDGDRGKLVNFTNAAAVAVTVPQAGTGGNFAAGWFADFECRGAGGCTLTPTTSTIDGAASLALTQNQGVLVATDGTNYFTQRGIGGAGGGSTAFNAITNGTNSTATMTVATGASFIGTGTAVFDWTAATTPIKVLPNIAGCTPTATGELCKDTTTDFVVYGTVTGGALKLAPLTGDLFALTSPPSTRVIGIGSIPATVSGCTGAANLSFSWVAADNTFECIVLGFTSATGTVGALPVYDSASHVKNSLYTDTGTAGGYSGTAGFSAVSFTTTGTGNAVIQPIGDFAVVAKQSSTFSAANIFEIQDSSGNIKAKLDKNGVATGFGVTGATCNPVTASATPAYDLSLGTCQQTTLTTNVTGPTLSSVTKGKFVTFVIAENGTGGFTWAWPTNVHGGGSIVTTANTVNVQSFVVSNNGTDLYATGPVTSSTGGTP